MIDLTQNIPLPDIIQVDTFVLPDIWPEFCEKQKIRVYGVHMDGNSAGSQKYWPASGVISEAVNEGAFLTTDTGIDSTSGGYGVSLGQVVKEQNSLDASFPLKRIIAVIPKSLPQGKQALLKERGVDLVYADNSLHAMDLARELSEKHGYWYTKQYWNEANTRSYLRVGQHIAAQRPNLGALACGVGSGGSLSGVAGGIREVLKNDFSRVWRVAAVVEPGKKVPGVRDPINLEPGTLPWREIANDVRYSGTEESLKFSHALWQQGACIAGPSSGFALLGGLLSLYSLWTLHRLDQYRGPDGMVELVVLFPDTREPYEAEYAAEGYSFS